MAASLWYIHIGLDPGGGRLGEAAWPPSPFWRAPRCQRVQDSILFGIPGSGRRATRRGSMAAFTILARTPLSKDRLSSRRTTALIRSELVEVRRGVSSSIPPAPTIWSQTKIQNVVFYPNQRGMPAITKEGALEEKIQLVEGAGFSRQKCLTLKAR